jgi:hypothetical protein
MGGLPCTRDLRIPLALHSGQRHTPQVQSARGKGL